MKNILYTVSAAAIALSAMTLDASARNNHQNNDSKYRFGAHENVSKNGKTRKVLKEKSVSRKWSNKKKVKHTGIEKKQKHLKKRAKSQTRQKHQHRTGHKKHAVHKQLTDFYVAPSRKVVIHTKRHKKIVVVNKYPGKTVVYKNRRVVYSKPFVYRQAPRVQRHQSRHHREPSLPLLVLHFVTKLTEYQMNMQRNAVHRATYANVGDQITWNDRGRQGTVTATREGTDSTGRTCREFKQTIEIGNDYKTGYGIACQNRNGDWEMLP